MKLTGVYFPTGWGGGYIKRRDHVFFGGGGYSGKGAGAQYAMERVRKLGGGGLQIFDRAIRVSESDDEAHPAQIIHRKLRPCFNLE